MADAPPTSMRPVTLLSGLSGILVLCWLMAGRIFPTGIAVVTSVGLAPPGVGTDVRGMLADVNVAGWILDQVLIAAICGALLAWSARPIGTALRAAGPLRWLVLWLSLALLCVSELLLLPVLVWKPLLQWPTDPFWLRHGAVTTYLLLKGGAWLAVIAIAWPGPLTATARWTCLGAWWITAWQTGQHVADFGARPEYSAWRPWGLAHQGITWFDWQLLAQFGLLAALLCIPGLWLVHRGAAAWLADPEATEATAPATGWRRWWPIVVALLWIWWLLLTFDRLMMAATSSVAYPNLSELRFAAGREKWGNFAAILRPPFADASLWMPLGLTLGRAVVEVLAAPWTVEGLARCAGYLRGVPAFLALIAMYAGPIAAAAGIAIVAAQLQLSTWPWPPACSVLPGLVVLWLIWQGTWPDRMHATVVLKPRPIPWRHTLMAIPVAFAALYLGQEPLLLPPMPGEPLVWPTIVAAGILGVVDPQFPQRIAWLVGWHVPLWIAMAALTWLLLTRPTAAGTMPADE